MLANESMAIGMKIHEAMVERYGAEYAKANYRSFGTICSATQERQDAVAEMMKEPPDLMLVIGGYNSSNTNHLAHLCRQHTRTFHIQDAACIDVETGRIRHKPELNPEAAEVEEEAWLPAGPFQLGITAGASTPNNKIGEALTRVLRSGESRSTHHRGVADSRLTPPTRLPVGGRWTVRPANPSRSP